MNSRIESVEYINPDAKVLYPFKFKYYGFKVSSDEYESEKVDTDYFSQNQPQVVSYYGDSLPQLGFSFSDTYIETKEFHDFSDEDNSSKKLIYDPDRD